MRIRFASSGRKGRNIEASAMLTMLPRLALVVIDTYLSVLANDARPVIMPLSSTCRSCSSSTTSAASRAAATALSTEIPRSAALSAGASLMPSPR